LPIEVFGDRGSAVDVNFTLDTDVNASDVYQLRFQCHSCGYYDYIWDSNEDISKVALRVNNGSLIDVKLFYPDGKTPIGNTAITFEEPNAAAFGGIGGGYKTVTVNIPITGLVEGENRISFIHKDPDNISIGFRVLSFDLYRNSNKVELSEDVVEESPETWSPEKTLAVLSTPVSSIEDAIAEGEYYWRNASLYDPFLDGLDSAESVQSNQSPLNGQIKATCSSCHAEDGRDLAYFNFSDTSIIKRSTFHGLSTEQGIKIAAYIRSLITHDPTEASYKVLYVDAARPWNPPYQPGEGLDNKHVHEWAAGAGLKAVLATDSDMKSWLFKKSDSYRDVQSVVDRFSTLNMRELPINLQLPDWNAWLPVVHPIDAFDHDAEVVNRNSSGKYIGEPFYNTLYDDVKDDVKDDQPHIVGANFSGRLGKWLAVGATRGAKWRTFDGLTRSAVKLTPEGLSISEIRQYDERVRPFDLAKRGIHAWAVVKLWEVHQSRGLEEQSRNNFPQNVCMKTNNGERCVSGFEAREWKTSDRAVFTRVPHFLSDNIRQYVHQNKLTSSYDIASWYHLQMMLETGNRKSQPNHFIYTMSYIKNISNTSGVPLTYLYWATIIKMRQLQTNGAYGKENGVDLRTAQPFYLYSTRSGSPNIQKGLGPKMWRWVVTALLNDFLDDVTVNAAEFEPHWANSSRNSKVQDTESTDFDLCDECFVSFRRPNPFDIGSVQGRNTKRVIPRLRNEVGVDEATLNRLIDWSEGIWPYGNWDEVRQH